jgi:hypothetical protein
LQLSAARDELKARGGARLSNGRLDTFLNQAKDRLEGTYPWPWLQASTTGTSTVTISDLRAVLFVIDQSTGNELFGYEPQVVAQDFALNGNLATTGVAEVYYIDGLTSVKTYPVSTATLTIRYVKFSPTLSADADTPLIPTRDHPTWVDLGEAYLQRERGNAKKAAELEASVFNVQIPQMVDVYFGRVLGNPDYQRIVSGSIDD